ncbi:MAG: hypothetical protein ACAH80_09435 [Alphaproteobacteria bacterium]
MELANLKKILLTASLCLLVTSCSPESKESFSQRMTAYPAGSDEQRLIHDLEAKGFKYSRKQNGAQHLYRENKTIACKHRYRVDWHADDRGKIEDIESRLDLVCL